ncbi:polyketide synthase dehydratase domain-containing protein, partial [Kitasatospora sp. NPDC057936]|uniref:polyketide synthase dehydratase domain-containing protein n=1 Tax=Kitasatospora sp. NPDC057936 TaxID=3346283 RepID=UPI0036DD0FDA
TALATTHTHGHTPTPPTTTHTHPNLPTYPFQRRRYWLEDPARTAAAVLDAPVELAGEGGLLFTGRLSLDTHPWLADHGIDGVPLVPGSLFVDLALRAGEHAQSPVVDELTLEAPLALPTTGAASLQLTVGVPADDGRRPFAVHARFGEDADWTRHASGLLSAESGHTPVPDTTWPPAGAVRTDVDEVYDRLAGLGYGYGPAFRNLRAAWQLGDTLYAEVGVPGEPGGGTDEFALHPALLDAALHLLPVREGLDGVRLPFSWSGVRLHATGATALRVRLEPLAGETVSLVLTDPAGGLVAAVDALDLRPLPAGALTATPQTGTDPLYEVGWTELRPSGGGSGHADAPEPVIVHLDTDTTPEDTALHALTLVQNWLTQ